MTYITCGIWLNEPRACWNIPQDRGKPWTVWSSTFSEINCACLAFLGLFRVLGIVNTLLGIILSNYLTRFSAFSEVQPKRILYESYGIVLNVLPLKIVDPVAAMVLGEENTSQRCVAHFPKHLGKADDVRRKCGVWKVTTGRWLSLWSDCHILMHKASISSELLDERKFVCQINNHKVRKIQMNLLEAWSNLLGIVFKPFHRTGVSWNC